MVEFTLYQSPQDVSLYGIPPLKSVTTGYAVKDWKLNNVLWRGNLRVVEISRDDEDDNEGDGTENSSSETKGGNVDQLRCEVRLEDKGTNELFACAPYFSNGKGVQMVSN